MFAMTLRCLRLGTLCLLPLAACSPANSAELDPASCGDVLRSPESHQPVAAHAAAHMPKRMGPLTVSAMNPRFFADASGRSVYLTGSHTWNNLVDMGMRYPPRPFDFDGYLDFLQAHHHNLTRLWAWEVPRPNDERDTPLRRIAAPQPWLRTGPGTDADGLPKFDLTKLDPNYFRRLRERVAKARERGIWVIVMLFEGWSVQFSPGKPSHPFYAPNNINDTGYLRDVRDIHTLRHPEITRMQERYVRVVIDTVNDLDNVLFEIANEAGGQSTAWQYAMLRFVKCYESAKPFQHPVGMTYQYEGGRNSTLFESDADWISPGNDSGNYLSRPDTAMGRKIIIADSDHLEGTDLTDPLWVYRSFFQGLNLLFMDRYSGPDALNPHQDRSAPDLRAAMGEVRLFADLFGADGMVPAPQLSTTGYALRTRRGLLVFSPDQTRFDVDIRSIPGPVRLEWFDAANGRITDAGSIDGGKSVLLRSPHALGSVLYLHPEGLSGPSLFDIESRIQTVRRARLSYASWPVRLQLLVKPALDELTGGYRILIASLLAMGLAGIGIGFASGWLAATLSRRRRA